MCLATPMKLVKIDGEYGFVEHGGREYRVALCLIDKPKVGDWLLAHGETAVNRVSSQDAKDILQLVNQSGAAH